MTCTSHENSIPANDLAPESRDLPQFRPEEHRGRNYDFMALVLQGKIKPDLGIEAVETDGPGSTATSAE